MLKYVKYFLVVSIIIVLSGCNNMSVEEYENIAVNALENKVQSVIESNSDSVLGVNGVNGTTIDTTGSTVVYKSDLYYYSITNYHVVSDVDNIKIVFSDDTTVDASMIGYDEATDLAVLKFSSSKVITPVVFGDMATLNEGSFVVAIGNPKGSTLYGSSTFGIISGLNRYIDTTGDDYIDRFTSYIQTDAAINPGNSGGGLFDLDSNLIGINSIKYVGNDIDNLGFAIPIDTVVSVISDIEEFGTVMRPSIGILTRNVSSIYEYEEITIPNNVHFGAYVVSIQDDSSVYGSTLQAGDIIVSFNGNIVRDVADITEVLYTLDVGDTVTLTYIRDSIENEIQIEFVLKAQIVE